MPAHIEVLPGHPQLGRNVEHWSESFAFAAPVLPRRAIASVFWKLEIAMLNQGNLGSCVPNSGTELLGGSNAKGEGIQGHTFGAAAVDAQKRLGYTAFLAQDYPLNEEFAQRLYAICTRTDQFQGAFDYPSGGQDTGSSGVGLAKAMVALGLADSVYTHAFTFQALQTALQNGPAPMGLPWLESMFNTAADGRVQVDRRSKLAGGHEINAYALDLERRRIWFPNHWGQWGVAPPPECGDFPTGWGYFDFDDLTWLLSQQGDVTVISPLRANAPIPPEPQPTPPVPPVADADAKLWAAVGPWAHNTRKLSEKDAASNVLTWAGEKGLV